MFLNKVIEFRKQLLENSEIGGGDAYQQRTRDLPNTSTRLMKTGQKREFEMKKSTLDENDKKKSKLKREQN